MGQAHQASRHQGRILNRRSASIASTAGTRASAMWMTLAVKTNKAFNPINARLLGANAVTVSGLHTCQVVFRFKF